MSTEQNKALIRQLIEQVWNKRNTDLIDEIYAEEFVMDTPEGAFEGPAGFRQIFERYQTAFPDCHVAIDDLVAEGDRVAIAYSFTGTNTGNLGEIPASGNKVAVKGTAIHHFSAGKIVRERSFWDTLGLMQQVGAVPTERQTAGVE